MLTTVLAREDKRPTRRHAPRYGEHMAHLGHAPTLVWKPPTHAHNADMEAHSIPRDGLRFPRSRRLLAPLSDERLVEQVRRGNDAAFEVIYERHHRGILSFCRHMLSSPDEAEDAVQHTFI